VWALDSSGSGQRSVGVLRNPVVKLPDSQMTENVLAI
jgi:hypothetical protein